MKIIFIILTFFCFSSLYSFTLDIEIPEPVFQAKGGEVIPFIDGYLLDGTGEKIILPYKRFSFPSKVVKVEILEKENIKAPGNLKRGRPLYRLSSMKRVMPVSTKGDLLPSVKNFYFLRPPTLRRDRKEFPLTLYPVIPTADDEIVFIRKIRLHFEQRTMQPLSPVEKKNSLLILTSDLVVRESRELVNFIGTKRGQGFRVDVATESDYKAGDLTGLERAEAIRAWLRSVYKDYYFLLIIGDPSPEGSDIPMIVARPNRGEVIEAYEETATDVFYGEITEDIDKNNNGIPGERADDITLAFELVVGRIPFYNDEVENVDKVLARTIRYIKESPSLAEYRRELLFPTSIAYYENQDGQPFTPKMDGAYVAKFIENYILPPGFKTKILVETEGASPSIYADTKEGLNYDSMLKSWNDSYGIVYWMGHGMSSYTVRTIWLGDRKGVGYPSSWDMKSETFVDSDMTRGFGDHTSPFVFQGSCLNGRVENRRNLGHTTLLNSAVGVITSTQVAYGSIWENYSLSSQDLFSYGVEFVNALTNNLYPAVVLQENKENWSNSSVLLTMKYGINYLGDPSLNLNMIKCSSDTECDDGNFCSGKGSCVNGYCEREFDALPCQSDTGNPCTVSLCDEETKSCVEEPRADGTYCGEPGSKCYEGMKCLAGECVEWGETDCSHLDDFCSSGFCDDETGLCKKEPANEGVTCEDNLFCTVDTKCSNGVCAGNDRELPEELPCNKVVCDNNRKDFLYLIDSSQNWNKCIRDDGKEGYCHYGNCQLHEDDDKQKTSSGCSVILF